MPLYGGWDPDHYRRMRELEAQQRWWEEQRRRTAPKPKPLSPALRILRAVCVTGLIVAGLILSEPLVSDTYVQAARFLGTTYENMYDTAAGFIELQQKKKYFQPYYDAADELTRTSLDCMERAGHLAPQLECLKTEIRARQDLCSLLEVCEATRFSHTYNLYKIEEAIWPSVIMETCQKNYRYHIVELLCLKAAKEAREELVQTGRAIGSPSDAKYKDYLQKNCSRPRSVTLQYFERVKR